MMDAHFYTVNVEWLADKKGILTSPELAQNVEVATPPPFQGGMEQIWSPEHLFTSAVVSCFMTTFLAIAANSKLTYSDFKCNAKVFQSDVIPKMHTFEKKLIYKVRIITLIIASVQIWQHTVLIFQVF